MTNIGNEILGLNMDEVVKWSNKRQKKENLVYVAGDLFSEATIAQRIKEGNTLKNNTKAEVFNPITDNAANDKENTLPRAVDVFKGDTEVIVAADTIIAELDREDVGVVAELGIAYGINFVLELLEVTREIVEEEEEEMEVKNYEILYKTLKGGIGEKGLLSLVPKKKIVTHYSDIRNSTAHKYEIPTAGLNHYVLGMIESIKGCVVNSSSKATDIVSKICNKGKIDEISLTGNPLK